jgi:hypothetical protein
MSGLAVLSFGFTRGLWDGPRAEDVQRMSAYAAQLESYTVVVDTSRSHRLPPLQVAPNFNAIPTNAFTRADSFLRMLCIGWRALRSRRFDLVQGQDPFFTGLIAVLLGKLFGRRVVVCVFGPNVYDANWLASSRRNRRLAPLGRWVMRQCDCIQVDGAMTARSLVAAGLPQEKIALKPVVPTNLERFLAIERSTATTEKLRLLCVSRLNSQKKLPLLLGISAPESM